MIKKSMLTLLSIVAMASMLTACSQKSADSTATITDLVSVDSSLISGVKYDAASQALVVQFTDGDTYSFAGVNQDIYDGLIAADSKGSYFQENIKEVFKSTKL